MKTLIATGQLERYIYFIREQRVMMDHDLADLYGIQTKHLKRAVRRNKARFPSDFMFELSQQEYTTLRCQIGALEKGRHAKYLPYAFTQEGVSMLSSVLNSPRAIQVNIGIMRAFVKVRELLATNKDLARKLEELEEKFDGQFRIVFDAIRQLMQPAPTEPMKKVKGFKR